MPSEPKSQVSASPEAENQPTPPPEPLTADGVEIEIGKTYYAVNAAGQPLGAVEVLRFNLEWGKVYLASHFPGCASREYYELPARLYSTPQAAAAAWKALEDNVDREPEPDRDDESQTVPDAKREQALPVRWCCWCDECGMQWREESVSSKTSCPGCGKRPIRAAASPPSHWKPNQEQVERERMDLTRLNQALIEEAESCLVGEMSPADRPAAFMLLVGRYSINVEHIPTDELLSEHLARLIENGVTAAVREILTGQALVKHVEAS